MIIRVLKPVVFVACLGPLAYLAYGVFADALGANPIDAITDATGTWTLRFVVATLLVTPLRRWTGWNPLIRFRRMLGLFAFFYGTLHFITYIWLDQFFDLASIGKDIVKRPFITVGFSAFVLLIPLAATSNNRMVQKLGAHWRTLHRLVYVIATLGILHYLWLVKADIREPVIYGLVLITLLILRLPLPRRAIPEASVPPP